MPGRKALPKARPIIAANSLRRSARRSKSTTASGDSDTESATGTLNTPLANAPGTPPPTQVVSPKVLAETRLLSSSSEEPTARCRSRLTPRSPTTSQHGSPTNGTTKTLAETESQSHALGEDRAPSNNAELIEISDHEDDADGESVQAAEADSSVMVDAEWKFNDLLGRDVLTSRTGRIMGHRSPEATEVTNRNSAATEPNGTSNKIRTRGREKSDTEDTTCGPKKTEARCHGASTAEGATWKPELVKKTREVLNRDSSSQRNMARHHQAPAPRDITGRKTGVRSIMLSDMDTSQDEPYADNSEPSTDGDFPSDKGLSDFERRLSDAESDPELFVPNKRPTVDKIRSDRQAP
ncbi:hypothetical protein C8A03DRAFT_39563, partial [Achaetomium macrosporum]